MNSFIRERAELVQERLEEIIGGEEASWFLSSVDNQLNQNLNTDNVPVIGKAMRYAVDGGKRIRPVLLMLSFESALGEPVEDLVTFYKESYPYVLDYAVALECIHAYSLVHDDLPAMDNDTYRRGELTVHAKYGEDLGILTGDSLLNLAFEIIFDAMLRVENSEIRDLMIKAGGKFAGFTGVEGMIGGQAFDLSNDHLQTSERVRMMVEKKTCGLIRAAAVTGAILAGSKEDDAENYDLFAYNLGLAYQAKDDLFDLDQDLKENKITIIQGLNQDEANAYVEEKTKQAHAALAKISNNQHLSDFAKVLMTRKV